MGKLFKDNKGFTLIELVVVIVILAILIGVSIAGYSKYIGQSKVNTDVQNAETIKSVLVNAQAEEGVYEELKAATYGTDYLIVTVNNDGLELSGTAAEADSSAYCAAVMAQLQIDSTSDTKMKTQAKDCSFTVTAKVGGVASDTEGEGTTNGSVKVIVEGDGGAYAGTALEAAGDGD